MNGAMYTFSGDNLDAIWFDVVRAITSDGVEIAPRGVRTKELINCTIHLTNPRNRYIYNSTRRLNMAFGVAEFLWIITGQNVVDMVSYYNSSMAKFSDDGVTLSGAYGRRLRGDKLWRGYSRHGYIDQLTAVIGKLRQDPSTRQAINIIWNPIEDYAETKDVPCTLGFQYLLRDGKLHMITTMRSNDVWLGVPYDVHQFTMIQEIIAAMLDVEIGEYFHNIGSLHLYENNYNIANEVLSKDNYINDNYEPAKLERKVNHLSLLDKVADIEKATRNSSDPTTTYLHDTHTDWNPYANVFRIYSALKVKKFAFAEFLLDRMHEETPTHPLLYFMKKAVTSQKLR